MKILNSIVLFALAFHAKNALCEIKNVIFFVGDGMGPHQMSLGFYYARFSEGQHYVKERKLNMQRIMESGETGLMSTHPYNQITTDSAAAATQMATGQMSRVGMVGMNYKGEEVETILERAAANGYATGLVSDMRITHATPAGFGAHGITRSMEPKFAEDYLKTKIDVLLGGGLAQFIPNNRGGNYQKKYGIPSRLSVDSGRPDERDLLGVALQNQYDLVFDKDSLRQSKSKRILGLFSQSHMPDHIQTHFDGKSRKYPTLEEMTSKAISTLSRNKKGFFLMVEGGHIDKAGHTNDASAMLHAVLQFDLAIGAAMQWAKNRNDTLVIVTADHECGGFGFSYNKQTEKYKITLPTGKRYKVPNNGKYDVLDKIFSQRKSLTRFLKEFKKLPNAKQNGKELKRKFNQISEFKISESDANSVLKSKSDGSPLFPDNNPYYYMGNYQRTVLLTKAISGQQMVAWGTGVHTATPVMVLAYGPEEIIKQFDGLHHATEIGQKVWKALGFKRKD